MLLERISKVNNVSRYKRNQSHHRYFASFPSDWVPSSDNGNLAILSTQPSNLQVERWMMIAKFCQEAFLVDSLIRKMYRFFKQQCKQVIRAQLKSHPIVCASHTIYAAFLLFKFCHEETTGFQEFFVPSFISNQMCILIIQCEGAVHTKYLFKRTFSHLVF